MGPARIDGVGREARRRADRQGGRLHQQRRHGKGWLSVVGLAFAARRSSTRSMRDVPDPKQPAKTLFQAKLDRAVSQARRRARRRALPIASRLSDRRARLGIGLHGVSRPPDVGVAQRRLRRRGPTAASITRRTTRSTGTRTSPTPISPTARRCRGSIGTAILRLADADILPFEFTATATTLTRLRRRDRGACARRRRTRGAGPRSRAAARVDREAAEGRRRLQRGDREGAPAEGSRAAGGAESPALHLRARRSSTRPACPGASGSSISPTRRASTPATASRRCRASARVSSRRPGTSRRSTSRSSPPRSRSSRRRSIARRPASLRQAAAPTATTTTTEERNGTQDRP